MHGLIDGDPFAGRFWPLTLELTHLDLIDPKWAESPTEGVLRTLHDLKISIVNWEALPKVFEATHDPDNDDEPFSAIEDYGADYGEDDGIEDQEDQDEPDEGNGRVVVQEEEVTLEDLF